MNLFKMQRLGTIMKSEKGNEMETEGVLNPAAVRGPDGHLYLFPRLVAKNNYSRIGIARVKFNKSGDPVDVERLGIALQPEADYEKRPAGAGGCEDARVVYLAPLNHYIMTYTAFGPNGPRIGMARSKDLFKWERLGLVSYLPYENFNFNGIDNKDACVFPDYIPSPHGNESIAMLHRPLFPGTRPEEIAKIRSNNKIDKHKESIWISYYNLKDKGSTLRYDKFTSHHRLAVPEQSWEELKIGAGAPPVLTKHGWLVIYHGVHATRASTGLEPELCYSAGVMILSEKEPQKILYRSSEPILKPELPEEMAGVVSNVVFPTGTDRRDDIDKPDRIDVYYGMADNQIGVARLDIPKSLD